jgi:hypothetical protein
MLAAEEHIPLVVPLAFLGSGIALVIVHRRVYHDLESLIRAVARARANSFFGDGDIEREFKRQWRQRWFMYLVVIGYFVATIWMLIISLTQL